MRAVAKGGLDKDRDRSHGCFTSFDFTRSSTFMRAEAATHQVLLPRRYL